MSVLKYCCLLAIGALLFSINAHNIVINNPLAHPLLITLHVMYSTPDQRYVVSITHHAIMPQTRLAYYADPRIQQTSRQFFYSHGQLLPYDGVLEDLTPLNISRCRVYKVISENLIDAEEHVDINSLPFNEYTIKEAAGSLYVIQALEVH